MKLAGGSGVGGIGVVWALGGPQRRPVVGHDN